MAILGGGIMGSLTAIALARRGVRVTLFERNARVMEGASRWNEGKIHLGCLYAASRSLATAKRVLPGGLAFRSLLETALERPIGAFMTDHDDLYLVHENSVAPADETWAYMRAVAAMVETHSASSGLAGRFERLAIRELPEGLVTDRIVGAFRVPERSVATEPVADAIVERLEADPAIDLNCGTEVRAVRIPETAGNRYAVETSHGEYGGFDVIINALWEGRPLVDARTLGFADAEPNHRYRVSAFVTNSTAGHPSAVVSAGPFGDVKSYGSGRFYLSWYDAGLMAEGEDVAPPAVPERDADGDAAIIAGIRRGLGGCLPGTAALLEGAEEIRLRGGWVYAQARGRLDDPAASLHSRHLIGVRRHGGYISIDTGKYSTAPLMAEALAAELLGQAASPA